MIMIHFMLICVQHEQKRITLSRMCNKKKVIPVLGHGSGSCVQYPTSHVMSWCLVGSVMQLMLIVFPCVTLTPNTAISSESKRRML